MNEQDIKNTIEKEKELSVYEGEDKVISSHEMQEKIKNSPKPEVQFNSGIPRFDKLTEGFFGGELITIGGAPGQGKALDINTKIPTPNGWKTMGKLKIGDIVFSKDGSQTKIINISEIMYDRPCYEIHFSDGSIIKADKEHLWLTMNRKERMASFKRTEKYRRKRRNKRNKIHKEWLVGKNIKSTVNGNIRTTKEIFNTTRYNERKNHSIEVCEPIILLPKKLSIDPYILGIWLGDGCSYDAGITTSDKEIVDYIYKFAKKINLKVRKYHHKENGKSSAYFITRRNKKGGSQAYSFQRLLREYNLIRNKHIPPDYLRGSIKQRLNLLQGLNDSDGYANEDGSVEFTNTNEKLANNVFELVLSLGIKATKRTGAAKLNGKIICKKWRIRYSSKLPVFRLGRKLKQQKRNLTNIVKKRFITRIIKIKSVPVKCIQIEHPSGLFLVGNNFIPTHNSLLAQTLTCNFIKNDILSLWFSYEMPPRDFLKRFPELPLFYMPSELKDKSIEWIEERILEAKVKYDVRAIMVDHLHYLVDMARLKNPSLEIGQIVRNLKLIAIRNNLVIFLICPLKIVKPFQEVGMSDIRDSSITTHEADCVILMWRLKDENEYCNKSILKIDKHRRNGVIDKKIKLIYQNGLLGEYAENYEEKTTYNPPEEKDIYNPSDD